MAVGSIDKPVFWVEAQPRFPLFTFLPLKSLRQVINGKENQYRRFERRRREVKARPKGVHFASKINEK